MKALSFRVAVTDSALFLNGYPKHMLQYNQVQVNSVSAGFSEAESSPKRCALALSLPVVMPLNGSHSDRDTISFMMLASFFISFLGSAMT